MRGETGEVTERAASDASGDPLRVASRMRGETGEVTEQAASSSLAYERMVRVKSSCAQYSRREDICYKA
jgi:hypothetical protein